MPNELGVQIEGMVRWTDEVWVEIIYAENVLQKFRLKEVADAARLPRVIHRAGGGIGPRVEAVVVLRFVHPHAPQDYRGMIPISLDHRLHVFASEVFPFFVADVLPP